MRIDKTMKQTTDIVHFYLLNPQLR